MPNDNFKSIFSTKLELEGKAKNSFFVIYYFLAVFRNSVGSNIVFNSKRWPHYTKIYSEHKFSRVLVKLGVKICFLRECWTKYCILTLENKQNRFSLWSLSLDLFGNSYIHFLVTIIYFRFICRKEKLFVGKYPQTGRLSSFIALQKVIHWYVASIFVFYKYFFKRWLSNIVECVPVLYSDV